MTTPTASAILFLVRNPYSWLVSMYAAPYEYDLPEAFGLPQGKPASFSEFLRTPFSYKPDGWPDEAHHDWHLNPVRLWVAKVESYAALARRPGCAVHALRFAEHVDNGPLAACALVLALPADVAGLWRSAAREACRRRQQLEGWNAAGRVQMARPAPPPCPALATAALARSSDLWSPSQVTTVPLEGGGSFTTGPGHATPRRAASSPSTWADGDTLNWLAAELSHLSPDAVRLTNYLVA